MRLIDYFVKLFAYVLTFIEQYQSISFDELKNKIDTLIRDCDNEYQLSDISSDDYDTARFAVFTWIDETILQSDCQYNTKWRKEALQKRYYKTTRGADLFFQKSKDLKQNQNHVKEIFFTCLCFGFKGKYHHEHNEILLRSLKSGFLQEITGSSMGTHDLNQAELIYDAYPRSTEITPNKKSLASFRWSSLILLTIPVILYFFLLFFYQMFLDDMSNRILKAVLYE